MESIDRGFIFGTAEDGTLYIRKDRNQYTIEFEQKIKEWLEYIQKVLKTTHNKNTNLRRTSKGYFRLILYSKDIFYEIKELRKDYKKLLLCSRSFQIGFLQGIFDAEGTVHKERFQIRISSKKLEVVLVIKQLLESLGIMTGRIHKDIAVYILPFYGKENIERFHDIIGFRHNEKRARLSNLLLVNPKNGVVALESPHLSSCSLAR